MIITITITWLIFLLYILIFTYLFLQS